MSIYFPGLNGIRAIAALIVIFFHVNGCMWFYGSRPIRYFEARDEMSRHAVVLFFVLSGYLITYLLIREKESIKRIDIRKFYVRRILRIWPLYYLAILLAIIFIPITQVLYPTTTSYSLQTIGLYSLLIPNFAILAGYMIPSIAPLWSVGVEEQFYAFWPWCIKKSRSILKAILIFLFACISIKAFLFFSNMHFSLFGVYFTYFSLDTLAIGATAAYLYHTSHPVLKILYHPIVEISCWLFFVVSCILGPLTLHFLFDKDIYATVFAIIVLNVSTNKSARIRLNAKPFEYLGKISYGMYICHPFMIILSALPMKYLIPHIGSKPIQLMLISAVVVSATIVVAHLSYRYYESIFLRLKTKFIIVRSANEPNALPKDFVVTKFIDRSVASSEFKGELNVHPLKND
jgi:peptidoglycan/LPS O-acetylase OafA/YrhL